MFEVVREQTGDHPREEVIAMLPKHHLSMVWEIASGYDMSWSMAIAGLRSREHAMRANPHHGDFTIAVCTEASSITFTFDDITVKWYLREVK